MNFHIKSRGIEGLSEIEAAINHKMERFNRILDDNAYIELELKQFSKAQNNGDKEAEIIADIPGHKSVIRFAAQAQTYLEAVDTVLDKLDGALSRDKERRSEHHRHHEPAIKERVATVMNQEEI